MQSGAAMQSGNDRLEAHERFVAEKDDVRVSAAVAEAARSRRRSPVRDEGDSEKQHVPHHRQSGAPASAPMR